MRLNLAKQLEVNALKAQIETLQSQMTNRDKEIKTSIDTLEKKIEIAEIEICEMKKKLELPYLTNQTVVAGGGWIISEMLYEKGSKTEYMGGPSVKGRYTRRIYQ